MRTKKAFLENLTPQQKQQLLYGGLGILGGGLGGYGLSKLMGWRPGWSTVGGALLGGTAGALYPKFYPQAQPAAQPAEEVDLAAQFEQLTPEQQQTVYEKMSPQERAYIDSQVQAGLSLPKALGLATATALGVSALKRYAKLPGPMKKLINKIPGFNAGVAALDIADIAGQRTLGGKLKSGVGGGLAFAPIKFGPYMAAIEAMDALEREGLKGKAAGMLEAGLWFVPQAALAYKSKDLAQHLSTPGTRHYDIMKNFNSTDPIERGMDIWGKGGMEGLANTGIGAKYYGNRLLNVPGNVWRETKKHLFNPLQAREDLKKGWNQFLQSWGGEE